MVTNFWIDGYFLSVLYFSSPFSWPPFCCWVKSSQTNCYSWKSVLYFFSFFFLRFSLILSFSVVSLFVCLLAYSIMLRIQWDTYKHDLVSFSSFGDFSVIYLWILSSSHFLHYLLLKLQFVLYYTYHNTLHVFSHIFYNLLLKNKWIRKYDDSVFNLSSKF